MQDTPFPGALPSSAPLSARWPTRLALLAGALLLGGCAAMSEEECRSANWFDRGQRDALSGHSRSYLGDIREACAKARVVPDAAQYYDGWNRGIVQFCTPANGARWGREGRSYSNSCPAELEAGFAQRYHEGRRVWNAEQNLKRLQNELNDKQRALDKASKDSERAELRRQLRDLDRRLYDARYDLDRAEWNLRRPY
ncbi:DUF2799 domain-containing protein [Melaminivora sp.]|uniref:DUF2799 domain-containing protein n=1 Tax=Melaminivora sp. TaxID=1933032 RepID=UPI0028A974D3|nr:DUF2799 domain-containing protein [Melaminivora sp.]